MRISTLICCLVALLLVTNGCFVRSELKEERKEWKYSSWEQQFKDRTLCLCILQGLNNRHLADSIAKIDKSFYDPLSIAIFDPAINALLRKELIRIQLDSANSVGQYPVDIRNLVEGKRVMSHCIDLYRSRRLDSIVKVEKRGWSRINNILDKIHEKIPTY